MSALANTHTGSTKCPQENCEESHVYRGEGEAVGISNLLALETVMMELHAKGCWRTLKIKRKKNLAPLKKLLVAIPCCPLGLSAVTMAF